MSEQTTLSATGLNTSPNELGNTGPGGLNKAQNCVMLAPGLITSRVGEAAQPFALPADANELAYFGDEPIWQCGADTLAHGDGTEAITTYAGTYAPPDPTLLRMKFMEMAQNEYFNTTKGVYRLDQVESVPVQAGVIPATDILTAAVNSTTGGFLQGGASCAYRLLFGTKDSHNTLHLGAPSGRIVVTNPNGALNVAAHGTLTISGGSGVVGGSVGGTLVTTTWAASDNATAADLATTMNANAVFSARFVADAASNVVTITYNQVGSAGNAITLAALGTGVMASGAHLAGGSDAGANNVDLTFPVPSTLTTRDFFQLYRTPQTVVITGSDFLDPGDEEQLCYEQYLTSAQLAAGTVSITDTTSEDSLGVPLYSNAISGQGVLQSNDTPPFCKDMTSWNGVAWYANTRQRQSVTLEILGCGPGSNGATGVRMGDTLWITYAPIEGTIAFVASPTESNGHFKLYTSGDVATNIEQTTRSLVNAILTYDYGDDQAFRAQYLSGIGDAPGRFSISGVGLDGSQFNVWLTPGTFEVGVGDAVRTTNIVAVTTQGQHGLAVGDTVLMEDTNSGDAGLAGTFTVATVPAVDQFTYASTGANTFNGHGMLETRIAPAAALAWRPPPPIAYFTLDAGSLVRATNVVTATVTTGSLAFLKPGVQVVIEPVNLPDANFPAGTKAVTSVTSTTFTYAETAADATSATDYQSGARVTSDPYQGVAGPSFLSFSKIGQPEAVPQFENFFGVGRTDTAINRIFPQGANLFVFKQEGIYIVTFVGGFPNPYRVDLLDNTVHLYAPDSVTSVAGRIFALTNQGVVTVTNAGAKIISTPIEQDLFQYFGPTLAQTRVQSTALGHETARYYRLELPVLDGGTGVYSKRRAYVFSTIAGAWTNFEVERNCGRVRVSDDALLTANGTTIYLGNNSKTSADFTDGFFAITPIGWDPDTKILSISGTTFPAGQIPTVGDAIVSPSDAYNPSLVVVVGTFNDHYELTLSSAPNIVPPDAATGTITITDGYGASVGSTIGGITDTVAASQLVGASIDGNAQTVRWATSDSSTASAASTAFNGNGAIAALVSSSPSSNIVTSTAVTPGAAANAITMTPTGTNVTVLQTVIGADAIAMGAFVEVVSGIAGDDVGPKINGTNCLVTWATSNDATAHDLVSQINMQVGGDVTASYFGPATVQIVANVAGLAGAFTITNFNAHTTFFVSPSAADAIAAEWQYDFTNSRGATDDSVAAALAAAITADADASAIVTASATANVVTIAALRRGPVGNSITLAAVNGAGSAGASASGATLSGGSGELSDCYIGIPIELQWRAQVAGAPADEKMWQHLHTHFRESNFRAGDWLLQTDQNPGGETLTVAPARLPNGDIPDYTPDMTIYPGMPVLPTQNRSEIPQGAGRAAYFTPTWEIREAFALWTLNGITLVYVGGSERTSFP